MIYVAVSKPLEQGGFPLAVFLDRGRAEEFIDRHYPTLGTVVIKWKGINGRGGEKSFSFSKRKQIASAQG